MPCGLTVLQDTTPLGIHAPTLNWWSCQNGDLTSWAEPWVLSLLLRFPTARLHSAYQRVNTLAGPKWKHNLASEGFILSMDGLTLTVNTATEHIFSDPLIAGYSSVPIYGRKIELTTATGLQFGGSITKSTYIKTTDSIGATDCWVIFDFLYNPASARVEVYGNKRLILNAPIVAPHPGGLILSDFSFSPTPISDPMGEIHLNNVWPNDGITGPTYTIVPHAAVGYPNNFISMSPVVGFIEINRGISTLPHHSDFVDPTACSYIGNPLVSLEGPDPSMACISMAKGVPFTLHATSDHADNGLCEIWWDATHRA